MGDGIHRKESAVESSALNPVIELHAPAKRIADASEITKYYEYQLNKLTNNNNIY